MLITEATLIATLLFMKTLRLIYLSERYRNLEDCMKNNISSSRRKLSKMNKNNKHCDGENHDRKNEMKM